MRRNIPLMFIILSSLAAYFWLGTWVLYYLRFTNYTGIGLIEMVQIFVSFSLEIPTGAIADLIGKKRTLFVAVGTILLGNLVMAFARDFSWILVSVTCLAIGYAFSSGTSEALIYDSLKDLRKEKKFSFILSRLEIVRLFIMGVTSIIGGFLYSANPSYPYLACVLAQGVGLVCCFFLTEPKTDTEKFSLSRYLHYTKQGFWQLIRQTMSTRKLIGTSLIILAASTIFYEVLDGAIAIEFGYSAEQLGVLFAVVVISASIGVYVFEKIPLLQRILTKHTLLPFGVIVSTLFISPMLGLVSGGMSIIVRNIFYPFIRIDASNVINSAVDSKYRATTLSTFTMLSKAPYLFLALFIGRAMDTQSSIRVAALAALFFTGLVTAFLTLFPKGSLPSLQSKV